MDLVGKLVGKVLESKSGESSGGYSEPQPQQSYGGYSAPPPSGPPPGGSHDLPYPWVSRWDDDRIIQEVRTYVDAGQIIRTLWDNEIYMNSSDRVTHRDFVPGPGGLPDIINSTQVSGMAKLSPGLLI